MKSPFRFIKRKIRAKLFSALIVLLAVFLVAVNFVSYPLLMRAFTGSTYREMTAVADAVKNLVPDPGTYYIDIYTMAKNHNMDLEITDADNYLIYTTTGTGSALSSDRFATSGSVLSQYSRMTESTSGYGTYNFESFEIKKRAATSADYFVYRTDLPQGELLYVYCSFANVKNVVDTADRVYSVFSIVMVILLGAVFFVLVSRFLKPIVEINDVTKGMANLRFDRKCNDYGADEIGELGKNINTLSDTLDKTLDDLKDKNEQLEKDIAMRLALDNARKSFIGNVSHELKTPIAIISGYAEGLCDGLSDDPEVIREYCGIIREESRNMNKLVTELLELSKLESRTAPFSPEEYCLGERIVSLLDHFSLQIQQAGIAVINNVPEDLMCCAEKDKIDTVLRNYISNAISHCDGDKLIVIDCMDVGSRVEISVFNTGENIDSKDIDEIWDSFYRADKAHARSENRFGLGLSIVKSIMNNHGSICGVRNEDGGVRFTFEVPKEKSYYEDIL